MRVVVDYQDEDLEFEVPSERVVASWRGPEGLGPDEALAAVRDALEDPGDFPPLRRMIVPGDRVAIALDPSIPRSRSVLDGLVEVLLQAGAAEESLAIVSPPSAGEAGHRAAGDRAVMVHDPDDRTRLAYLASTKEGRRIYLNRAITDADLVIPVGRLGFDPDLGFRGPWSILFPGLSDRKTMKDLRDHREVDPVEGDHGLFRVRLDEALEVGWLLGTQFHLGVVPGRRGPLEVIAGNGTEVRVRGMASLEQNWTFRAPARAEMVIAGVGSPGPSATLGDLATALATATRLVQHGGKIVVVSRVAGTIGPALQRMRGAEDPRAAAAALHGHADDDDYSIARRIARASTWADVFVASALDPEILEDLSIVPLERPEQARKLAASAGSLLFIGQAELTRAFAPPEVDV